MASKTLEQIAAHYMLEHWLSACRNVGSIQEQPSHESTAVRWKYSRPMTVSTVPCKYSRPMGESTVPWRSQPSHIFFIIGNYIGEVSRATFLATRGVLKRLIKHLYRTLEHLFILNIIPTYRSTCFHDKLIFLNNILVEMANLHCMVSKRITSNWLVLSYHYHFILSSYLAYHYPHP